MDSTKCAGRESSRRWAERGQAESAETGEDRISAGFGVRFLKRAARKVAKFVKNTVATDSCGWATKPPGGFVA